jgi:enoyl-CoA hydratase/carnithine racemase
MQETISAIRELNEHPDTVFTVLTGEGRFFSAGADVRGSSSTSYLGSQQGEGRADHMKLQDLASTALRPMPRKQKRRLLI